MEIQLKPIESERIFFDALCGGMDYLPGYGLQLSYNPIDYNKAKEECLKEMPEPCREDIWLKMLKMGYSLTLIDGECDGEYTKSITIDDVYSRVNLAPVETIIEMLREEGDANTADTILQTVFFKEVVFG
jgi:hypothetical protein